MRVYKLSKERRRALTDLAAGVLRLGEPTVFAFEATCRHGLRSNLCLQHWPWIIADLTAAGIVDRALHRVGARRPRWIEGQRQYVDEGVTQIDRRDCIQCGRRLPENHSKFCSKICAGAYRNATRNEEQREAERARKLARAFEYRLQAEAKTCEGCGHSFKPNYPEQRFCSRTCSGSRSVAEKMNGKAHPWANGKGKTGGNAVHHAEQSSLNGDTPPASSAPSDVRIDTSITSHPKTCAHCGRPILGAKRQDKKYCCLRCQWRARYWRKTHIHRERKRSAYRGRTHPRPSVAEYGSPGGD